MFLRVAGMLLGIAPLLSAIAVEGADHPDLFISRQLTPPEYTRGIEGPAFGPDCALYVVNFRENGTIGRLKAGSTVSELFATLPAGSVGNGIRFDRSGRMYVADYRGHNILVFERGRGQAAIYFHSPNFNQPNDLAMGNDGTIFASDPNFRQRNGRVWRIERLATGKGLGSVMTTERRLGVANGIDLSPNGETLYVGESDTRELWAYRIEGNNLAAPRLVIRFDKHEIDGLRTDASGRIFVARPGSGVISVITPEGILVRDIALLGKQPSNLTFGGTLGDVVYVTQVDGRFIEWFRTDKAGREVSSCS